MIAGQGHDTSTSAQDNDALLAMVAWAAESDEPADEEPEQHVETFAREPTKRDANKPSPKARWPPGARVPRRGRAVGSSPDS